MTKIKDIEDKTCILEKAIQNEITERNPVPFIVHEAEMVRAEVREDRNKLIILILIICLFLSNMAWLYVFQSYDYTSTITYKTDTKEGGNAIINRDVEVNIDGKSRTNGNND